LDRETFLRSVVRLLPAALLRDEEAGVRITLGNEVHESEGFAESRFLLAQPLVDHGEQLGRLEVCYPTPARAAQSLFLPEESQLLKNVAERIVVTLERLATKAALVESEKRYRRLVENAPDVIYRLRVLPDLAFEYVNPAAAAVTGYTPEEHYTDPGLGQRIVDPDDHPLLEAVARGEISLESPRVLRLRHKDGRVIWAEVRNTPVVDKDGRLVAVEGVIRDVTEQHQTVEALQRATSDLERALKGTIEAMGVLGEMRDAYTHGHEHRVHGLAVAIADRLGLGEEQRRVIDLAAVVHDIGKVVVPVEILSKPGKLSVEEFALIRQHPEAGYQILAGIDFGLPVADVVRCHHERMDGSGYPRGLTGDRIPMAARILAVADVAEAIASHRPYRPALGVDVAVREVEKGRGTLFDTDVVDAFVAAVRDDPALFEPEDLTG